MSDHDAAFREVMGRPVGETDLKNLDLYLLGELVLNSIGATLTLGHSNPAHTLDYTPQPGDTDHVSQHIIRDLLAWTSGRKALSPGCEERLSAWVQREWLPHQMGTTYDALMGGDAA